MHNRGGSWKPDIFTCQFVDQRARELAGRGRAVGWDAADIRNELLLNLWRRQWNYDPRKGRWTTFVRLVTDHHIADLLVKWRRRQRVPQRSMEPMALASDIDDRCHDRRFGRRRPGCRSAFELRQDVAAVLDRLPTADVQLCQQLKLHPIAEVARRLGCSRTTIYQRIRRIRLTFEGAGMRGYL